MDHSVIAVFDDHNAADAAVKRLSAGGFDMTKLSVVGKGYHTEETITGFYNVGDRMKLWGKRGAMWGGLWGLFFGGLFLTIPLVGHVIFLGYIAAAAMSAAEGAVVLGGLSALGAALSSLGIPKDSVLNYETAIKADGFLVMAHGSVTEMVRAKDILASGHPSSIEHHTASTDAVRREAVAAH
jgi:hypothetical protein